jgi:hypothetical protein
MSVLLLSQDISLTFMLVTLLLIFNDCVEKFAYVAISCRQKAIICLYSVDLKEF